jgi:phage shock protein A
MSWQRSARRVQLAASAVLAAADLRGAARHGALAGEGLTLAGVRQVLALDDQIRQLEASLAAARAEVARLRAELAEARAGHDRMPARPNGRR